MTTTIPSPIDPRRRPRGFTLVEVLIAATMSAFVLAGVLSTFLFLGRSGIGIQNYNDMETEARRALEMFAEDVRQASAITWTNRNRLTLTVNAVTIEYRFDSATRSFLRNPSGGERALVTGVTAFSFKAYTITGAEITDFGTAAALTAAGRQTKQLQISLEATRAQQTVVAATNTVLSARFILRNKIITA